MRLRIALGFALTAALTHAQAPRPPMQELIDELIANADLYNATLPSVTASESIESEASYLSIFRDKAKASGAFRVLRDPAGGPLKESRTLTEFNGKPIREGEEKHLPTTLFGGFGRFQEMFLTARHRLCYTFTPLPEPGQADLSGAGTSGAWQIAVATRPPAQAPAECADTIPGITGLLRVDPATHQLLHMERTVPEEPAVKAHLAPFASVDVAPATVGDKTFWLPTLVVGTFTNGKIKGRFVAHYSNYHRFGASMTVLPGVTEIQPDTPPEKQPEPVSPK